MVWSADVVFNLLIITTQSGCPVAREAKEVKAGRGAVGNLSPITSHEFGCNPSRNVELKVEKCAKCNSYLVTFGPVLLLNFLT